MDVRLIEVYRVVLSYWEPFRIAPGVSAESHNVIVKVVTDNGVVGWGEASPSKRVCGETSETVLKVLDRVASRLVGVYALGIECCVELMDDVVGGNPSAKAAIDMALHDILGKSVGAALFKLLGGYRQEVLTDLTLSVKTPKEMARDAVRAVERGFRALKVKVGVNPKEDVERIQAIREAVGSNVAIRIDANEGWTPSQAIEVLEEIERFNIEFVEQPVKANDVKGLAKVRKNSSVPVMADEAVHSPEDALRLIRADAVDLINIKLMKCGGLLKARKIAAVAEAAHVPCMIGCMGESKLGISAAVHLAAAVKNIQYTDLDSDLLLKDKLVVEGGAGLKDSKRLPTEVPGLGVIKLDEKILGKPVKVFRAS